jgi:Cu/Ag efflux pump CusA
VFDVVVWGAPEARQSVSNIRNLLLEQPDGGRVRLGDVAEVRIAPTPTIIHHEGISPRVDVVANVQGRDVGAVGDDIEDRLQAVNFPLEYHPEVLGEFATQEAAEGRLLAVGIAAAIAILLLLQKVTGSWRMASLLFLTLPVALVGGVLASLAAGGTLSLGSLVGFLAVVGIAARSTILLIKHYQHLEEREGMPFGPSLVLRGTEERFVPILLTAAATAAVLLPVVLLGDVAGLEVLRPMAVVMLGGLVTVMLVSLYVVPALYLRFGGRREPELDLVPEAVPPVGQAMPGSVSTA